MQIILTITATMRSILVIVSCYSCLSLSLSVFLVSLNIIGHANVRGEEEIISLSPISCNVY